VLVTAFGLWRARRADRHGDALAVVALVGLTTLLVSPLSWVHHGVWLIPALGVLVGDARRPGRVAAAIGVAALTAFLGLRFGTGPWSDGHDPGAITDVPRLLVLNPLTVVYAGLLAFLPLTAAPVLPQYDEVIDAGVATATSRDGNGRGPRW